MKKDQKNADGKDLKLFQIVKADRRYKSSVKHIKFILASSIEEAEVKCKKMGYSIRSRRRIYYDVGGCASIDVLLGIFKKENAQDKNEAKEIQAQIKELEKMKQSLEANASKGVKAS